MPRLFGLGRSKSKSNVAASSAAAAEDDVGAEQQRKVKKSKSFKRIRGLLKKVSGRSKKQLVSNDEQSLYGVDVDERSVMTRQTNLQGNGTGTGSAPGTPQGGPPQMYILKVVLLLMDPETRRFELLQLEFDSLKALVSDVLAQIPISVTEDALRLQSWQ
jgi:hypothetical protein